MSNANHPIWPLLRLVVLMAAMVGALWVNATNFDETEVRSIVSIFLAAGAAEGIGKLASYFGGKEGSK